MQRSLLDRFPVRMHPARSSSNGGAEIAYQFFNHVILGKKPSQQALTKRSFSTMLLRNADVVVAIDAIEQGLTSRSVPYKSIAVQQRLVNAIRAGSGL